MRRFTTLTIAAGALAATQAFAIGHWQGRQKALVVLLEWSNAPVTVTREAIEETLFGAEGDTTSLRQFFLENSGNRFDLSGDVLDWRRSSTSWRASNGCNLRSIVNAAWSQFGRDVDVASYDSDGNGKIDNFFVVHSGRIGSDRVGPDCTFTSFARADHAVVFQSRGLGSIGEAIPIGFYLHEAGHGYFNFPDLYGDHYHGRYGIAMWGMMGLGAWGTYNQVPVEDMFRIPSHFEPYSKVRIGWVRPREVRTTTRGVVLRPVETTSDIVAVPLGNGVNFYLEYRSRNGFSSEHRGHGLLIWKNYQLVQADGRDDLNAGNDLGRRPLPPIDENFGDDTDPFPGASGVTSYADPREGVSFENIRREGDRVELDVVVTRKIPLPAFHVDHLRDVWDGVERL